MKKLALILIGIVFASIANAQDLISNFQKKFEKDAEFTVINITPKMFELIAVMGDDNEEASLIKNLTGLKLISTTKNAKKHYNEASKMLAASDHEELMSVVDSKDNIRMYTKQAKKGVISSLIIAIEEPDEFTLIGITGTIDLKQLASLSNTLNIEQLEKIDKVEKAQ